MRKYFLLSAVALMVATNVNAAGQSSFNASVNIELASKVQCTRDLDFGKIVVVADEDVNSKLILEDSVLSSNITSGTVLHDEFASSAECNYTLGNEQQVNLDNVILEYAPDAFSAGDIMLRLTPQHSLNSDYAITIDGVLEFEHLQDYAGEKSTTVGIYILNE